MMNTVKETSKSPFRLTTLTNKEFQIEKIIKSSLKK
jgi:hypothetical protein